jgi:hypothetical protein
MTTYVFRDGRCIEKQYAEDLDSDCAAPHVIRDQMDALRHMADGKMYDSKSAFRKATKAAGCVEVGDQPNYGRNRRDPPKLDKRERVEAIKKTIYDLKNGNRA